MYQKTNASTIVINKKKNLFITDKKMDETTGHKVKKENPNRSKKTRPNVAPPDEVVITDDEANNDRETGELVINIIRTT